MTSGLPTLVVMGALLVLSMPTFVQALDDARVIDILVAAYPDFLAGPDGNEIVWKDATRMALDDGKSGERFSTRPTHPRSRTRANGVDDLNPASACALAGCRAGG